MRFLYFLLLLISPFCDLLGERGIIMAVSDKYMHIAVPAIAFIRFHHHSDMPIEVWHAGGELSDQAKAMLQLFQPLVVRDISQLYPYPPTFFRGFQIKGFIGEATRFDEFLLMDADVFLYMSPESLFDLPQYKQTGAFFFRDNTDSVWRQGLKSMYEERHNFIVQHIPKPSSFLPKEWHYYWQTTEIFQLKNTPRHHLESGVVVMNKLSHKNGLASIRHINESFQNIYRFIPGDKETFWMGLEECQEPYSINDNVVFSLIPNQLRITYDSLFHSIRTPNRLVQCIGDTLCFQQKVPVPISFLSKLVPRAHDKSSARSLRPEEKILIEKARRYYQAFCNWDLLVDGTVDRYKAGHG